MDGDNVLPPDAKARMKMLRRVVQHVGAAQAGEKSSSASRAPGTFDPGDASVAANQDHAHAQAQDGRQN